MTDLLKVFRSLDFNQDENAGYNSRVLIVDSLNTFMRSYCAIPALDDDGRHVGGMSGFLKSLGHAIKLFHPTRVVLVFDGQGGSQRRRKLYSDYKSNRKPPTRLNRQYDMTTAEQEAQNMKYQLVSLIEMLECLPVTIFALDNVEADDVIAYFSEQVIKAGGKSVIYSTDKDFLQLVSEDVKVYNPVLKKSFTIDTVLEKYNVHPFNFVFYRALLGDDSDNIKGIRGAGAKTVVKYIPELAMPLVSVDMNYVDQKYENIKKPKLIENIILNKDIVERNLKLMNLHDVDISTDAKLRVLHKFQIETSPGLRKQDLTKLMMRAKILSTIPNYNEWITTSFATLAKYANR